MNKTAFYEYDGINKEGRWRNSELRRNVISDYEYYKLVFYTGDFEKVKNVSKNPEGSLGWSSSFFRDGIRLFLLYLYEKPLPSKAAAYIASYIGFFDTKDRKNRMQLCLVITETNMAK